MKRIINIILILTVIASFYFLLFKPDWVVGGLPPLHNSVTITSCAPGQYIQGQDKNTGAPVCINAQTGCSAQQCNNTVQATPQVQQIEQPKLPNYAGK